METSIFQNNKTMRKYYLILAAVFTLMACERKADPDVIIPDSTEAMEGYVSYSDPALIVDDSQGAVTLDPNIDNSVLSPVQSLDINWTASGRRVLESTIMKLGSYGGSIGTTIAGALSPILSKELFGPDPDSQEIMMLRSLQECTRQMDSKLDLIIRNTELLYWKLDEVELNALMDKFIVTKHHLESVKELNNFTYALLDATSDPKEQYKIIDNWAKAVVNGNTAYLEVSNILREVMDYNYKYNGVNVNFCAAIDLFVFSSVAWELSGYDYREAFRAQIACEISRASILLYTFYTMTLNDNPYAATSMNNIIKNLELLEKFIDESAVVHHDDYAILQLPGHHVKWRVDGLNKRARSVRECCDQNNYAQAYLTSMGYLWAACYRDGVVWEAIHYQWDDDRESDEHIAAPAFEMQQFTEEEIKAIVNYYMPAYPDITLLDAIQDGGIVISEDLLGSGNAWLATSDTEIKMYTMSTENHRTTWVFLANYWPLKEKLTPEPVSQEPRPDYNIVYTDNYNKGTSQFHNACVEETWFESSNMSWITRIWHQRFFFRQPDTFYFPDENLLFFSQHSKYSYKTPYEN